MTDSLKHAPGRTAAPLFTGYFILLLVSNLCMCTGIGWFYLFPLFVIEFGGSKTDVGILMGTMSLAAVFVRPVISRMVDGMGRKKSYALGCGLMGAVSLAHIFFMREIGAVFAVLGILRFLFGVGLALGIVASITLGMDMIPEKRLSEGLGILGITPLVGIAVGPVGGEWVLQRFGFTALFGVGALVFTATVFCIFLIRETYVPRRTIGTPSFFGILSSPLVWRMALITLLFGVGFAAHGGFVAPFAQSKGMVVSAYFAAYSSAAVLSRFFGGRLADRFGERRVIRASLVMVAAGFAWMSRVDGVAALAGAGFVAGLGHGMLFPSLLAAAVRDVESSCRGKVTGVVTGGVDAGVFIGSMALGYIGDHLGFSAIFQTAVAAMLAGLLFANLKAPPARTASAG